MDVLDYTEADWERFDWIMDCTDPVKVKRVLDELFKAITPKETEAIGRAYFDLKVKQVNIVAKKNKHKHKNKASVSGGQTLDPRIYHLLALADTVHDFVDTDVLSKTEAVEKTQQLLDSSPAKLPVGMTIHTLLNEYEFIRFMKNRTTLDFGEPVTNPVFGGDLFLQFGANKYATMDALFEAQRRSVTCRLLNWQKRLCPVDIYTDYSAQRRPNEFIKIHQLAQLCGAIRLFMGPECVFELDLIDNHLVQLIVGIGHVSEDLYRRFFDPTFVSNAQVSEALIETIKQTDPEKTAWRAFTTDANLFDPAVNKHKFEYDPRPTGTLFPDYLTYQICLQGVHNAKKGSGKYVKATIVDHEANITADLLLANSETTKLFSTNTISALMGIQPPTVCHVPRDYVLSFNPGLQLALKRAGDWGQVENAKKYDKVFVTSDKLAALYAYYRGVRFIYLRRQLDQARSLFRYTFLLGRSDRLANN